MSLLDQRYDVITIINEVQTKLGLSRVTRLDANDHTTTLLQLLNELVSHLNDFGDWQEDYIEVLVTAESSVKNYSIKSSGRDLSYPIKRILEVAWSSVATPLMLRTIPEIRLLNRTKTYSEPRFFAVKGVDDNGNPMIEVWPIPGSAQDGGFFDIALYKKTPYLTKNEANDILPYPGQLLVQGLYAKALLEQDDGDPSPTYQASYQEFLNMRSEALNRYNSDTGDEIQFIPERY